MLKKLAVKRLTTSDLTFFKWQFLHRNAGNQKAINLNADVFIAQLFPILPEVAIELGGRIPVDLNIYGPGLAPLLNLQRKIIKGGTYKNWRLDGEYIESPPDQPDRFNILERGDFAVFDFKGTAKPNSATLIFVCRNTTEDNELHAALNRVLGNRAMISVSAETIETLVTETEPIPDHPIFELTLDESLEDVALGGYEGAVRLARRPRGRYLSREDLQKARQQADEIGRIGERYVDAYLSSLVRQGRLTSYEWVAEENPTSPYDFRTEDSNNTIVLMDAKSTKGVSSRRIHISLSELIEMAEGAHRYDLYRVFELDEAGARIRVAEDTRPFAINVLETVSSLPDGVRIDGISVDPSIIGFQEPIIRIAPDEE